MHDKLDTVVQDVTKYIKEISDLKKEIAPLRDTLI